MQERKRKKENVFFERGAPHMKKKLNKKGNIGIIIGAFIFISVLAGFGFYMYGTVRTLQSIPAASNPLVGAPAAQPQNNFLYTNPDGGTSLTINDRNVYNFTEDAITPAIKCYQDINGMAGSFAASYTAGTAATGQNFGQKLICKGVSSSTDHGSFYGIEGDTVSLAAQGTFLDTDGFLHLTIGGADRTQPNSHIINLLGGRYSAVQAKAYDVKNSNFMYDSASATNNVFKTTGKNWTGVTNNATCTGSAGNYFQYRLDLQSVLASGSHFAGFNEDGVIVGFQIPTATYGPSTSLMSKYNGAILAHFDSASADLKTGMTEYESSAYTADNFKFFIPPVGTLAIVNPDNVQLQFQALPNRLDQAGIHTFDFYIPVKGGVTVASNNADDILLNLHPRGQYLSTDGKTVKIGAVKDDGANTAVRTVQLYRFCVTT